MMPVIFKQAASRRRLVDPTYTEMRLAKLEPNMSESDKWNYRAKGIHVGEQTGAIVGTSLGTLASGLGASLLARPSVIRNKRLGKALGSWVLPPVLTYLGYTLGAKQGKIRGEQSARHKLRRSGNHIAYVDPLTRTERGPFDPLLLSGALAPRAVMAAIGEKGNMAMDRGVDRMARLIRKAPKLWKR